MKRALVLSLLLVFGVMAFAGPFLGMDYDGKLDLYTGVAFDTITVQATFADIVQTPSVTLSLDAKHSVANVDLAAGIDFVFEPFAVLPAVWGLDRIALAVAGEVDLSALFETEWDVELSGDLGLMFDDSLIATLTWGVGFYVEMPWPIIEPIDEL